MNKNNINLINNENNEGDNIEKTQTINSNYNEFNKKLLEESKVAEPNILKNTLPAQFPISYKEEEEKKVEEWNIKMGDNIKYVDMLKGSPYSFDKTGFKSYKYDGGYDQKISNALVIPIKKINIYDGENQTSEIELKAILNTCEVLPTIKIPIKEIDGDRFYTNPDWGIKIRFNLSANKKNQSNCIKYLANNMIEETIFNFMGVYKLDNKYIFLHNRWSNRDR